MATVEVVSHSPNGRPSRISNLFRKLAHLKPNDIPKKTSILKKTPGSKTALDSRQQLNNPYPESGHLRTTRPVSDIESRTQSSSAPSAHHRTASLMSLPGSARGRVQTPTGQSNDPSMSPIDGGARAETIKSDAGHSKARTAGGMSSTDGAGANSTFSSPYQSQKSLATTLTTIQSNSPNQLLGQDAAQSNHVSAVPQHLGIGGPSTYMGATANNILSDDASILTLASSSKKHRRRSMDTDASVRAMAPGSMRFDNGSRESLPLSVLSGSNMESTATTPGGGGGGGTAYSQSRPNYGALASAERASVYSSQSIGAPVLASERNSYYATSLKQMHKDKDKDARSIDGRSVHTRDHEDTKSLFGGKSLHGAESLKNYEGSTRSGAGHVRSDSVPSGHATPLAMPSGAGPRPFSPPSRTNSTFERDTSERDAAAAYEGEVPLGADGQTL